MPQYSFTSDKQLIDNVDEIANRESRTRSEMIDLLLRLAVKEKNRKRNGKKDNSQHNTGNMGSGNSTG